MHKLYTVGGEVIGGMMLSNRIWTVGLMMLLAASVACGWIASDPSMSRREVRTMELRTAEPIRVVVSIPPLKGLVSGLLEGIEAKVDTLIPVGVSEHGYEIPAGKLAMLAKADLVVYVGRGLEPQVGKFLDEHPKKGREVVVFANLVKAKESPEKEPGESEAGKTPQEATQPAPAKEQPGSTPKEAKPELKPGDKPGVQHKPDEHGEHDDHACEHDHEHDPHLWLDPRNVKKLLPGVREAIERVLESRGGVGGVVGAGSADADRARLRDAEVKAMKRVDEIDEAYQKTLAKATDRTIVVAHDAYTLLAERYELKTVAIAGLHASEPTMKDIRQAIEAVKSQDIKVVFVEPQLSRSAADKVAKATKAKVLVLDPVGGEDWFATMSKNLDAIAQGLGVTRVP